MKKISILLLFSLLLVGCNCKDNNVIHSGTVESVYERSIAINGKLFEGVCSETLEDISVGDQVNIYCSSKYLTCSYVVSKAVVGSLSEYVVSR